MIYPICWDTSARAFSPAIPFTPLIASPSLSLSLCISLALPPLSLLGSRSRMFPYMATALCSQSDIKNDEMNEAQVVKQWPCCGANRVNALACHFCYLNTPLPQRCPSFSACLSCNLSIFPSFLLSPFLLCVTARHVTPSHLRNVVASLSFIIAQTKSVQLGLVS